MVTVALRAGAREPNTAATRAFTIARSKYNSEIGPFQNFISGIVTNLCSSARRKEQNWRIRNVTFPEDVEFADPYAADAFDRLVDNMDRPTLRTMLARALRDLDWRQRQYLWLRFWRKLTNEQIFNHRNYMSDPVKSCSGRKSRVHRALEALRSVYFRQPTGRCCPPVPSRRRRSRDKAGQALRQRASGLPAPNAQAQQPG